MRLYLAAPNAFKKIVDISKIKYALTTFIEGEKSCYSVIKTVGRENFLLDSGAYSFMNALKGKPVDFNEYQSKYIDFINKADVKYFFNLDLDNIIGIEKTKQMRDELERRTGKKCVPVWHKCMGLDSWKQLTKDYDYVAMGTMHEIKGNERILKALNNIAKENNCKVHGLGFTPKGVEKYGFYSTDSTSWFQGFVWGAFEKFDGRNVVRIASKPSGYRIKDRNGILQHNFQEWLKYQAFLDKE